MKTRIRFLTIVACMVSVLVHASPPGTAFTYQGRLNDGGAPANGSYVFRFTMHDQAISGGTVVTNITTSPVDVTNGLFTVTLDYGAGTFAGADRWLGIEVHTNQINLAFIPLAPRQPVLPTPYAIYAASVEAAGITGIVPNATNFSGPLLGDVTGTQGATSVAAVGGQSATNVASGVSIANAATTASVPGRIVKRDGNGDFAAGSVTLSNALHLPFPAIIYAGTDTVMIAQGSFFTGPGAGRGAPVSGENTGCGDSVLSSLTTGHDNTGIGERALEHNTHGYENTASGTHALQDNTSGSQNTAVGTRALQRNNGDGNTAIGLEALRLNSGGFYNTASGGYALWSNTGGSQNTANGFFALGGNADGDYNTANGYSALRVNQAGSYNTANGAMALQNTTSSYNTANGYRALYANTTGSDNTATGANALQNNATGPRNTACGAYALESNTTGPDNTASGYYALSDNTIGSGNTANGYGALSANTEGNNNTASGNVALSSNTSGEDNTAIGVSALRNNSVGSRNVALGVDAGFNTTGNDNIDIGNDGVLAESGTIRIGTKGTHARTFIAGISEVTVAGGDAVRVTSSGQLGIVTSSARFKRDIRSMDDVSDVLLSLHPVTFRYKLELDPQAIPQFGLVAEEVEKVDPDLVARDDKNQVYTVRYEAVNAMLLNEFLKQHRKVEEQKAELQELKQSVGELMELVGKLARDQKGGAQ